MSTTHSITTAEELLAARPQGRCELVRGEFRTMSPAGFEHGWRVIRIAAPLDEYVQRRKAGVVTGAETGFLIQRQPDTVRAPDVGFIRAERIPSPAPQGFFPGAPDLAVEVLSPFDAASEVLEKVQDWLSAGTEVVWVVDPRRQTIALYAADRPLEVFQVGDMLTCPTMLPGFALSLAEVFQGL